MVKYKLRLKVKYIKEFKDYNINSDLFLIRKVFNSIKINLYYAKKHQLSILNLYKLILKLTNEESRYNILLMTICAVSILTRENKEKIKDLFNFAITNGITEEEINNVINKVNKVFEVFVSISRKMDLNIKSLDGMLNHISLLTPFTSTIIDLIDQDKVDIDWFNGSSKTLKMVIGMDKYKTLIGRILHKLKIIVGTGDKFQNVENVKPLLADQAVKPPMYKKIKPSI